MLGRKREEIVGKHVAQFGEDTARGAAQQQIIEETLARGEWRTEVVNYREDGAPVILDCRTHVIHDEAGAPTALFGISTDITERKQAEEALRETSLRLTAALESGQVGLWDWNLETNKVFYSTEWKRQVGWEDNEVGDDLDEWRKRAHPGDVERVLATIQARIAAGDSSHEAEFRFQHRDGHYLWILARARIYRDAEGKAVRILGSHVDITGRKRAEEGLREAEERMRVALDAVSDGIWEWDVLSGKTLMNARSLAIFGMEAESGAYMQAQDAFSRIHPDDLGRVQMSLQEHIKGETPVYRQEFRVVLPHGGCRWVLGRGRVIERDAESNPLRIIGTNTDITEQKAAQAERERLLFAIEQASEIIVITDTDAKI